MSTFETCVNILSREYISIFYTRPFLCRICSLHDMKDEIRTIYEEAYRIRRFSQVFYGQKPDKTFVSMSLPAILDWKVTFPFGFWQWVSDLKEYLDSKYRNVIYSVEMQDFSEAQSQISRMQILYLGQPQRTERKF